MNYSSDEVMDFIEQEGVRFIRLAFTDPFGRLKNIAVLPEELPRAFSEGISFDASAIAGFTGEVKSDLFLFPIADTLATLPWRSAQGKVVRMFCDIRHPDGTPFAKDSRAVLRRAIQAARAQHLTVNFGPEYEFYLFETDERGRPTKIPFDTAGYMDVAPEDKGENIRREICLTLLEMGIHPETSHHEEGPGQNEIDFRYSDALSSADNAMNFLTVVKAVAIQNGLYADFSPKPLIGESGNGLHLNMSVRSSDGVDCMPAFMAGVLAHIREITVFLNPCEESYRRLGEKKAPRYVTWSHENRSQLIRIPAAGGDHRRFELRSPDPTANPYLAYALLIHAGLDGVRRRLTLPEPNDLNLYHAPKEETDRLEALPGSLEEAARLALESEFVASVLPEGFLDDLKRPAR
ncbi:MAG: glutamine synthetase family protein [Clostridiales bacterium]|nr:glutamine synthetase family protein [Clostridiales bacterium]